MCVSPRYHESIGMWDRRQKHIAQMGLHQTYPLSPALGTRDPRDPTAHGQKSQVPLQLRGKSAPGILLGFPAMMTELSIPWLDPHWTPYLSVQWSHPYAYVCLHTQTHVNHWQNLTLRSSLIWLLFEDSTSGTRSCSDQTSIFEFGSHSSTQDTKGGWRHMMDMVKTLFLTVIKSMGVTECS